MIQSFAIIFLACFTLLARGSYLGYPRINFRGFFRADPDTRNNNRCNYRHDYDETKSDFNADWGYNGTNEFEWYRNKITSVFRQNGTESTDDPILGKFIVSNLNRPYAKLVDLDTDCQDHSTIYGMKFGIADSLATPEDNLRLFGSWTPSIIAQDFWVRIACYSEENNGSELYQGSFAVGVSSTTFITDIAWRTDNSDSPVLQELQAAADAAGGRLHVRVALSYYTRNRPSSVPINSTLGYVMGTIGVPSPSDTLNVGGQRILSPVTGNPPVGFQESLVPEDLCYGQDLSKQKWVSKSAFEIDENSSELRIDLASAFPVDLSNTLLNIGKLQLAMKTKSSNCIELLNDGLISYVDSNLLNVYSGILNVRLENDELDRLLNHDYALLVVQVYDNGGDDSSNICGENILSIDTTDSALILGQEPEYFIRPTGYYVDRLSKGDTVNQTFYVTRYNKMAANRFVRLVPGGSLPANAIVFDNEIKPISSDGTVDFTFTAVTAPPAIREYPEPPCKDIDPDDYTLPIDGNIYLFGYQVCTTDEVSSCKPDEGDFGYALAYLFFSELDLPEQIDWVHDVGPILTHYAKVSPVMKYILDMSSYNEVLLPYNRELMKLSLTQDFYSAGYMPITRNLSPARKKMILAWLNQQGKPLYNKRDSNAVPDNEQQTKCFSPSTETLTASFFNPLRCKNFIPINQHPGELYPYYKSLIDHKNELVITRLQARKTMTGKTHGRPLMGVLEKLRTNDGAKHYCLLGGVAAIIEQLQTAIQLEFATIPVYLTTLYSIVDGCNLEVKERLRSIAMQEMVHFAQAANILIAIGGDPKIDFPDFIIDYPTNLPGDVLPGLTVSLNKLTLEHVREVLMAIEIPVESEVGFPHIDIDALTIGALYEEVKYCIGQLDESIFSNPRLERQVLWPWTPEETLGTVTKVQSREQAQDAIDMIVHQGEGTGLTDPNTQEGELSHFYKLEEIACENELVYESEKARYSYSGPPVPVNDAGVWNIRENPKASTIQPNTNCYTEAKAFHTTLRKLLRSLDEVFNGSPERVNNTILIMESLQVHAKKTAWTKFSPDSTEYCGPIWEYYWPGEGPNTATRN